MCGRGGGAQDVVAPDGEAAADPGAVVTLAGPARAELEVKRSRFLAAAARCDEPDEALAVRDSLRVPDARHNCWAYKIGSAYRFSDDGEPGGSAGRPILGAIEGQGLDRVVVVVARYFGGTKLGVGGLVRAYGGVTTSCLAGAEREVLHPEVVCVLEAPFQASSPVFHAIEQAQATIEAQGYTPAGLRLSVRLRTAAMDAFRAAITEATSGQASLVVPEDRTS